jgi:hypothetical protein
MEGHWNDDNMMDCALGEAEGKGPPDSISGNCGYRIGSTCLRGFWREADASGNVGARISCSGSVGLISLDMVIGCWPTYRSILRVLFLRNAGRTPVSSCGVVDDGNRGGVALLELEAVTAGMSLDNIICTLLKYF